MSSIRLDNLSQPPAALVLTAPTNTVAPEIAKEIDRRRTFAIISHPDAGKTTLTEKLLLYGGAIHLAGSVTARKNQNSTASYWMDMEKERGISVSSTVLQFEYEGACVNLLDTPGHHDFSEDTYSVLSAVDSAVMVIDAGKGIEAQTLKLFEVCRKRGVPIFVFINNLDRAARPPLELIDELERVLGLPPVPINWPLGDGPRFRGVFNRETNEVNLFERTPHGSFKAPLSVGGIDDERIKESIDEEIHETAKQEIDLLDGVTEELDMERVLNGKQMPIFFGSAMNNFGVELMLKRFLELAPGPASREAESGPVDPHHKAFSGFVFKIQANMNPRHRDRAVFIRIVSGVFERDMQVIDAKSGKKVRLGNAQKLFGKDRETLDEAYAGDILALVGNYDFLIGDTLTSDNKIVLVWVPQIAHRVLNRRQQKIQDHAAKGKTDRHCDDEGQHGSDQPCTQLCQMLNQRGGAVFNLVSGAVSFAHDAAFLAGFALVAVFLAGAFFAAVSLAAGFFAGAFLGAIGRGAWRERV